MCNRCVKNRLKILKRLWKKWKIQITSGGGFFLTHTVHCFVIIHYMAVLSGLTQQLERHADSIFPSAFNSLFCYSRCLQVVPVFWVAMAHMFFFWLTWFITDYIYKPCCSWINCARFPGSSLHSSTPLPRPVSQSKKFEPFLNFAVN